MIFEFIIAYRRQENTDIQAVLTDTLGKVLEDNLNDFEQEVLAGMIRPRHEREGDDMTDANGTASRHMLLGFALELPEDTAQPSIVVEEFAAALFETVPVYHAVKFEDPLLSSDLAQFGREIFALEMKLRRVLSFIYLHAKQGPDDSYDLLRDESVQPMGKEKPKPEQMMAAAENQFFHLTFSNYIALNQRPELKLPSLLSIVRDSETYDAFRAELARAPINHEDDAILVAGLKERMDAIEVMRNCVAHNRRPTRSVINNYLNARPLLNQMLDDYLVRWERRANA